MNELLIFLLGGLLFKYGIDILDNIVSWFALLTQILVAKYTLYAAKIQAQIDVIGSEVSYTNQIGFVTDDYDYDNEEDGDYEEETEE